MFKSKLFEEWLNEIKEARIAELLAIKEMVANFKKAKREQMTYKVCGYDPFERAANESEIYINYLKEEYQNYYVIPEMSNCSHWTITKEYVVHEVEYYNYNYELKIGKTINCIINIDGQKFEDYLYTTAHHSVEKEKYNGLAAYLATQSYSISDAKLIEGRDEAWIIKKAEKENDNLRKSLQKKVEKICGEEIVEVTDAFELYLKGSNGRTAKLWAIRAGGYNIQRLHTRVLCKEVK